MKSFSVINLLEEPEAVGSLIFPACGCAAEDGLRKDYECFAVLPNQVHSCDVAIADKSFYPVVEADAIVSFIPGVTVGVVTADCVPVLLYAPDIGAVAAVHAGWKGTLGGILDNTVSVLAANGAEESLIKAVFGPSISMPNYEVDEGLAEQFSNAGFAESVYYPQGRDCRPHLDLQEINVHRLLRCGVDRDNIRTSALCSYGAVDAGGKPLLPSHRRSGGRMTRMLSCIRLK